MGQSFHITIDNGTFAVDHIDETVVLNLPSDLQELKGLTEDKDALMAWIEKHDYSLQVFHTSIQKRIIDLRAIARPAVKTYKDQSTFQTALDKIDNLDDYHINEKKLEITLRILKDPKCQERLNKAEWKPAPRPGTNKAAKAIDTAVMETLIGSITMMLEMGNDLDQIEEQLNKNYSENVVEQAIKVIKASLEQ